MNWFVVVNLILLVIGAVAGWGFIIAYTLRYNWWTTDLGAHLISFSGVATLFYTLYLVRTLQDADSAPGTTQSAFNLIRLLLFALLTVVMVWRFVLMVRLPRRPTGPPVQPVKGPTGLNEGNDPPA